ncbi:MAG: hypothetical protein MAG715_00650 [Methanonatronarchaeales archaeon]|nr:hypothetical protein [Methanonatronarchaeales archaeon]
MDLGIKITTPLFTETFDGPIVFPTDTGLTETTYVLSTLVKETQPASGGYIEVQPLKEAYSRGEQIALTAIPSDGYKFDHWSGDSEVEVRQTAITMDSDKRVVANFVRLFSVETSSQPRRGGEIELRPDKGQYEEGEQITIIAQPYRGYELDYWSGDVSGDDGHITKRVSSDLEVVAHFKEVTTSEEKPDSGNGNRDSSPLGSPGFGAVLTILLLATASFLAKSE